MFKSAFVVMAPDGDPKQHRTTIKTSKLEMTMVVIELRNFDQAVEVCRDLVQKEGVQAINLCPGFTHEAVARIASGVGSIPISVARGDMSSAMMLEEIVTKEGWFSEE
jgi:hypothetical protein